MSKKEFGNRDMTRFGEEKVSTYIPGWQKAVQKYGAGASIEDLHEKIEVEDSPELVEYAIQYKLVEFANEGECVSYPVHEAARNGPVQVVDVHRTNRGITVYYTYC